LSSRRIVGAVLTLVVGAVVLTACVAPASDGEASSKPTASQTATTTPTPRPTTQPTNDPEPVAAGVEPVLVVASADEGGKTVSASGYVAGVVEDGGSCHFIFEANGTQSSADSVGIPDVRTTSCGLVQVPVEGLGAGSWKITLEYTALDANLYTSLSETVNIP
jgi:hypothetical protein